MSKTEQYRQNAADCLHQAQESSDPENKALLLTLAQAWVSLAEQACAFGVRYHEAGKHVAN